MFKIGDRVIINPVWAEKGSILDRVTGCSAEIINVSKQRTATVGYHYALKVDTDVEFGPWKDSCVWDECWLMLDDSININEEDTLTLFFK